MNRNSILPRLYDVLDASRMLGGLSQWTLRKNISLGRVRVVRLGRRVFLDAEEIERIRREGLPSLSTRVLRVATSKRD
jgi:hypothetical protein